MSTANILILLFAVAMIAMHLRSRSGHAGHGAGHGGGCGGGHAGNSEASSVSHTPTVRTGESADPSAESNPHRGHERG